MTFKPLNRAHARERPRGLHSSVTHDAVMVCSHFESLGILPISDATSGIQRRARPKHLHRSVSLASNFWHWRFLIIASSITEQIAQLLEPGLYEAAEVIGV